MTEKQSRLTNVLLVLILIVLVINLAVDLYPYYLTGKILGSFFRSENDPPFLSIFTDNPEPIENPVNIVPTATPWKINLP
jgi:hypothetical protein